MHCKYDMPVYSIASAITWVGFDCLSNCCVVVDINHKKCWYVNGIISPPICLDKFWYIIYVYIYYSTFTSEDQPRVKGPRTRRQGKEKANHISEECRTLRSVPEEGGGERVLSMRGREPRSTSGSKSGQQTQQFPTSRGLVSRPVRFA